jgi:hypothetical protein
MFAKATSRHCDFLASLPPTTCKANRPIGGLHGERRSAEKRGWAIQGRIRCRIKGCMDLQNPSLVPRAGINN